MLVVVAEDDPGRLLAEGPIRSIPPRMYATPGTDPVWSPGVPEPGLGRERALALWWDGSVVLDGWFRGIVPSSWPFDVEGRAAAFIAPDLDEVIQLAEDLVERDYGARVVRLAQVGGRLVEV